MRERSSAALTRTTRRTRRFLEVSLLYFCGERRVEYLRCSRRKVVQCAAPAEIKGETVDARRIARKTASRGKRPLRIARRVTLCKAVWRMFGNCISRNGKRRCFLRARAMNVSTDCSRNPPGKIKATSIGEVTHRADGRGYNRRARTLVKVGRKMGCMLW